MRWWARTSRLSAGAVTSTGRRVRRKGLSLRLPRDRDTRAPYARTSSVVCWGSNEFDQVAAPDGRFEAVVVGREHSCALATDEAIVCWGKPGDWATWKPSGRFRLIAGGLIGNCALRTDGTIVCWGNYSRPIINREAPSSSWTEVTTRGSARCVRRLDGVVACWHHGANLLGGVARTGFFGMAPARRTMPSTRSHLLLAGRAWVTVNVAKYSAVGRGISCGLRTDDTVTCWGEPTFGRLDVPPGQFRSIAVGRGPHSCGLKFDGTVECWGISTDNNAERYDVPEGLYTAIEASSGYTCGIKTDKSLACWGSKSMVEKAPTSGQFKVVAGNYGDMCAITRRW